MRLDIHTHFNSMDPAELRTFVKQCEALETRVCICSGGPRCDHEYPDNEFVAQAVQPYADILIPFAFVDLWNTVDARCVERFREQGFRGLKCITPYYPYDHDLYMPIYEAAERLGLPVLFHTGLYRPNPKSRIHRRPLVANMRPLCLDRIARSFQNLKIIMAHMGTTLFRHEGACLVKLHPNLYVDLAGNESWMGVQPADLAKLLGSSVHCVDGTWTGFRKLVLGSDAYVTVPSLLREAQAWYSRTLQRVGVPDEIVAGIMGGTVAAWLQDSLAKQPAGIPPVGTTVVVSPAPAAPDSEGDDFVREMFRVQFAYLYRRRREEPWVGMDQALEYWTTAKAYLKRIEGLQTVLPDPEWRRILKICWETYKEHEKRDDRDGFAVSLTDRLISRLRQGYEKSRQEETARSWFGCFRYDYYPDRKAVYLHVRNAVIPHSPFEDMDARRREMRALVEDIERKGLEEVEQVRCGSWLNGLKPFQELFPLGYADSFKISDQYSAGGYGWWGQLITKEGRINKRRAQMVREEGRFEYPRVEGVCEYAAFKKHQGV